MAASVTINLGSLSGGRIHNPAPLSVAFEIEISECTTVTSPIPKRVRRRLEETTESKSKSTASLEDIEVKLKEADSRRQQFHEWLANKARPKQKLSPSHTHSEELAQRLEAKLSAAEQKRAELLAHEQTRLAKLHELRVAAKTEAQLRAEREREELGSKVESRVQQAETNRLALLEAERQRRAAVHERIAQSVIHRTTQEGRHRDRIEALRVTICQKIAAAEEKRAGLLEAEKNRAQACVLQARRVAKAVVRERELEMRKKKEKLEARLQRAKRQRAEYLMKRGGCRGACHNHGHKVHKHGDRLCRQLTRCWRQFRGSRRTTYALAQEYAACAINQELVTSLPFEQLATRITSIATLRSVKSLLARIESRLMLSSAGQFNIAQVDHLLKRLAPSRRKCGGPSATVAGKKSVAGGKSTKDNVKIDDKEMERYPARVFLCAYMILGQPDAVFSGRGEREVALADAASKVLPEFEALLSIILDGPSSTPLRPSSPSSGFGAEKKSGWCSEQQENHNMSTPSLPQRPFSVQLATFDAAWCSYLDQFVAWKVKDAQLLEEDLVRMACQLELSMLQKCRDGSDLSHDSQAIRNQVLEDQKLLRDRILHLTGATGAARMEEGLTEVRIKFNEALENGRPLPLPFSSPPVASRTPISSPLSPAPFLGSHDGVHKGENKPKVIRTLFKPSDVNKSITDGAAKDNIERDAHSVIIPSISQTTEGAFTNEKIVNEMLHDPGWQFADPAQQNGGNEAVNVGNISIHGSKVGKMQEQIRETMETAFWDGIVDGLLQSPPEYGRVVSLVGEIRKELENIIPDNWKQDLQESMDLELLSQVLESGTNDFQYLRQLLDYASGLVLKLGAPVRDSETKAAHQSLVNGLLVGASANGETQRAFANAMVKGLRFIFEQLQILRKDISSTRLRALAPLISGSAGIEYMRKAFAVRLGLSTELPISLPEVMSKLPRTFALIGEVRGTLDMDREDIETSLATVRGGSHVRSGNGLPASLPPLPSMRTGGRLGGGGFSSKSDRAVPPVGDTRPKAVDWKSNDTVLRMGILLLVRNFEPATEATVPETFSLNVERLRNCQNEFQRIIVMATGLLVARQGLTGRGVIGTELDTVMELGREKLDALLNEPTASIAQIGELLAQISSKPSTPETLKDSTAYCELMTRVLAKSLSSDDPVFARVSAAVGASLRAILLLGAGPEGVSLAELALKRIGGGGILLEKVTSAAKAIDKVASVTCRVHEPWYSCIITNII